MIAKRTGGFIPYLFGVLLAGAVALAAGCAVPSQASAPPPVGAPLATPEAQPALGDTGQQQGSRDVAPLTEGALKNAAYDLPDIGAIELRAGQFERRYGDGATQTYKAGYMTGAFGYLDGDDAQDAAAIVWWNGGGSGTFVNLVAMHNQQGTPQQVAVEALGDRVKIQSLAIENGRIVLAMAGFAPTDPRCCPSQQETRTYVLADGALKQSPTGN